MSEKITVPTLGESVTEATVSKWLKSQGDKVIADEPLVELETDKVNVEVPAPSNGILGSIDVQEGETVNVGSLLGTINNKTDKEGTVEKEIKNYNPPKKKIKKQEPMLFNEDIKKSVEIKVKKNTFEEPVLELENESTVEEPLIFLQYEGLNPSTDGDVLMNPTLSKFKKSPLLIFFLATIFLRLHLEM